MNSNSLRGIEMKEAIVHSSDGNSFWDFLSELVLEVLGIDAATVKISMEVSQKPNIELPAKTFLGISPSGEIFAYLFKLAFKSH